jgi:hypothetical protein
METLQRAHSKGSLTTLVNNKSPALPLVNSEVKENIIAAAQCVLGENSAIDPQALLDAISSTLPPLAFDVSLQELAQGVLNGSADQTLEFKARLRELQAWNNLFYIKAAGRVPDQYQKKILTPEYLDTLIKAYPHTKKSHRLITPERLATLVGAAILSGGGDAESINTSIAIIAEQIQALQPVSILWERANRVLQTNNFGASYIASLQFYAGQRTLLSGAAGPADGPQLPGRFGLPFDPNEPEFLWPPSPNPGGNPGLPFPMRPTPAPDPALPDGLECLPELLRAFIDIIGPGLGRLNYSIESIDSTRACPLDIITIHGSGFIFGSSEVRVRFRGASIGSVILSEPITVVSSTVISVTVPLGTRCGTIELELSEALTVVVCDATFTLNLSPRSTIDFIGGETALYGLGFAHPRIGGCLRAGETIAINHISCNTDTLTLTIRSPNPEFEDRTYNYPTPESPGELPRFTSFTIPSVSNESIITVEASVNGPCGSDTLSINIPIDRDRARASRGSGITFRSRRFRNWNFNIDFDLLQYAPNNREELKNAVVTAEAMNRRIAISGSGYSFSECVVSQDAVDYVLIDTINLNEILEFPFTDVLHSEATSILSPENISRYEGQTDISSLLPLESRLVYVESGIKIVNLNSYLHALTPSLALPTMGGSDGQSLAGAIGTGTHGSTVYLPPISDFVRAIHLIGPDAQEWWIEPSANPVTDAESMETQRGRLFSACTNIVYDDSLFNAALVSMGSAGIIYGVIYETVNAHRMQLVTQHTNWPAAKVWLEENILGTTRDEDNWFIEVTTLVTGESYISTKQLTAAPLHIPEEEEDSPLTRPLTIAAIILLFLVIGGPAGVLGILGALIGILVGFLALEIIRMAFYFTTFQIRRGRESAKNIRSVGRLLGNIRHLRTLLQDDAPREGEDPCAAEGETSGDLIYDILPGIINDLWELGDLIPAGRLIMDAITKRIADGERPEISREDGIVLPSPNALIQRIKLSVDAEELPPARCGSAWGMNGQWKKSSGFDRLVESHEYIVPGERLFDFVDGILEIANEIRNRRNSPALLLALPIRFTQRSRATLAMQRHPLNCHIELFVMERLSGTEEFIRRAREFAAGIGAIPHWGQLHSETRDFNELYGYTLGSFRRQMRRVANFNGVSNTFRKEFSTDRNLL